MIAPWRVRARRYVDKVRFPYFLIAAMTMPIACELVSMERVPTANEIRERLELKPFVVRPIDITGVYENIDIDSAVFHYRSSITGQPEFWRELRQGAQLAGWVQSEDPACTGRSRECEVFQRFKRNGELWFSSAEEVRVAFAPSRIVVGYVQSDQEGDPKPVHKATEGRFADEQIWPRFIRLLPNGTG